MSEKVDVSFETLHLISVLSSRFANVFVKCDMHIEQIYTLIYLKNYGKTYLKDGKSTKIVQRENMAKVLKDIFLCNDNNCTDLFGELIENGFLRDFDVKRGEKTEIFEDGRRRVLSLTDKSITKIDEFTEELRLLYHEIIETKHSLLFLPKAKGTGRVAKFLIMFLKTYKQMGL